jgi:hypothetical protein
VSVWHGSREMMLLMLQSARDKQTPVLGADAVLNGNIV